MRLSLTAVVFAAVWLAGCGSAPETVRAAVRAETARKPAPDFALKDADGKTVKLSDYKGKVVLLNFWATWCGPCKIEIPWFIEFEQNYRDQGFAVLGISMDDDGWESVKPYVARNKINYRILMGDDQTAQKFGGVDSLPTSFIIDREGRTASVHVGLVSKGNYTNDIMQLLGSAPDNRGSLAPFANTAGSN